MKNTTTTINVSQEEYDAIMEMREQKAKEREIMNKAAQIVDLLNEIKELGGYVRINRNGENRYLSKCGERLEGVRYQGLFVEILC